MSDPRQLLIWEGTAAEDLEAVVVAKTYQKTRLCSVSAATTSLFQSPDKTSEQRSQLLFGENFRVLLEMGSYVFGQSERDGYVGFVDGRDLHPGDSRPSLRVCALRTYGFSKPSIKSTGLGPYSLNSLLEPEAEEGAFIKAKHSGWFVKDHLNPIGIFADHPLEVARKFLHTPYLWGGNDSLGIDCSGLVQQSLRACGLACPRDSDQQAKITQTIDAAEAKPGDLIFWKGHVGFISGPNRLLHANAYHMAVVEEALDQAIERIARSFSGEPIHYGRIALGPV